MSVLVLEVDNTAAVSHIDSKCETIVNLVCLMGSLSRGDH